MHPLSLPVCRSLCALLAGMLLYVLALPGIAAAQDEAAPLTNDERILNYLSEIEIKEDSSMAVTETITVRALNQSINHGIYRDFPTIYNDTMFKRYQVGFILDEVLHNGAPSPYHMESLSNGVRIYAGSADEVVEPGEHEYTFKYRTIKQLGFYPDGDELYWNVTGTDWAFPIDRAEARVKLPRDVEARALKLNAYTGPFRATGQQFSVSVIGKREVMFRTTQPQPAYSGLTIVVGFPKGIVTPPDSATIARFWREQHKAEMFAYFAVPGVLLFLFLCWLLAGVDPRRGVVTPTAEPPELLSPAALRYVRKMGTDFTCFTAAVTNLATKGYIHIAADETGDYTLTQLKSDFDDAYPEEVALARALFANDSTVKVEKENHSVISAAQSALTQSLQKQYRTTYFYLNRHLSLFGILLSVGVLVVMGMLAPAADMVIVPLLLAGLALLVITIVFWNLLPRYTLRGRRLLDQLEGFRLGLQYGTEAALGIKGGDTSEQLQERFLGYAIALDAHQEWAKRMEQTLREKNIQPRYYAWYTDPFYSHGRYNYYDFTHNLAKSFTSSVSSASVAPGSSSGSSGGSSGGGGGGGGGGGW